MFKIKLVEKKEVAKETMAFYFEKPASYVYFAGQHTDWTEINPAVMDAEGPNRVFCFASSPQEDFLMIASRMRDTAFKNNLKNMAIGTEIEVGEPRGKIILLPESADRPVVFLVGGIGITPFRSITLDAAARKLPHKITLFYSNRTAEEAAFLDELSKIENPNYQFVPIFTQTAGHLTAEMLTKTLGNLAGPVYFIAGPPQFVLAMKDLLSGAGVDQGSVRSEEFEGY